MTGYIIAKEPAVLAGLEFAIMAFKLCKCTATSRTKDGNIVRPKERIIRVSGTPQGVLSAERTALNLLSRMSGIATHTRKLVDQVYKTRAKVYATRKTAPGLSFFDKEAVRIGGGLKHRERLDQMILIKDNHIAVAQADGITLEELIRKAVTKHKTIEVEVETTHDALCAAKAGAKIIMLDNFSPSRIRSTINALKRDGVRNDVKLEASGRINAKNIVVYAKTGVERISVGAITSSVHSIDMSLDIA